MPKTVVKSPPNSPKSFMDRLTPMESDSPEKYIGEMLDGENTPTKTEINEPKELTQLVMLGKWFALEGFDDIAAFIKEWVDEFRTNMISHKRRSRAEVVQMVSSLNQERSLSERLTATPEKGKT